MLAVADVSTDIMYMRQLMADVGAAQREPTDVFCDNAGAVRNANYPTNKRTKHLNLQYAITRDHQAARNLQVRDCDTGNNPADSVTKPLGPLKTVRHRCCIGIKPPHHDLPIISDIRSTLHALGRAHSCCSLLPAQASLAGT